MIKVMVQVSMMVMVMVIDGDVWIGWVGDGTDCTTGRKILDESRPCPRPRPPSRPPPPPPRPRPLCAIYCTQSKYIEHTIEL